MSGDDVAKEPLAAVGHVAKVTLASSPMPCTVTLVMAT